MPEMHFVSSSNVEAVGYDATTREVHVRFLKSGLTYVYYDVDEYVFLELRNAQSVGTYLNENIKPRYQCAKL